MKARCLAELSLFLVSMAFASACGDEGSVVSVEVVTAFVPGPQFTRVETELLTATPLYEPATRVAQVQSTAEFGQPFARGRRVASFDDVPFGDNVVSVRLSRPDGGLLVSRRVRVNVQGDVVLRIFLTIDCEGVMCPTPTGSPALNACFGGQCVDERCVPPNPEFCPALTFCHDASECTAPNAACASNDCVEGICVQAARESSCAVNEWCDPQRGCLPLATDVDASHADAGVLDGSIVDDADVPDSSTPVDALTCGAFCELADDPCHVGAVDCSLGAASCAPFALRPAGAPCGSGLVCDSFGECNACSAGVACAVGCLRGVTRCSSGVETCDLGDGAAVLDPGAACSSTAVCYDGEPCGTGESCSTLHECEICDDDGAACTENSGCLSGVRSCASGHVCEISSEAEYGASCVPEVAPGVTPPPGICDHDGECVACHTGDACELQSGCGTGTIYCAGNVYGYPAGYCNPYNDMGYPAGVSRDDTTCDGGLCDGAGFCITPVTFEKLGRRGQCGIRTGGVVACWPGLEGGPTVADVVGAPLSVEVSGDLTFGCSISVEGELWCWHYGESPALVPLPERARAISVSLVTYLAPVEAACVTLESGQLMCWGDRHFSAVGDSATPVAVAAIPDAISVDVGGLTSIAVRASGEVLSWGHKTAGALGDGVDYPGGSDADNFAFAPVASVPVPSARIVRSNYRRSCALQAGGTLQCWGQQLAAGIYPYGGPQSNTPQAVPLPFTDVIDFSVNPEVVCVLRATGEVWCYGNAAQILYGGATGYIAPTPIAHLSDVVQLEDRCARTSTGAVYCLFSGPPYRVGNRLPIPP